MSQIASKSQASPTASQIGTRVWSYAGVLKDDGLSYMAYVEQLTFLLFLKMADELSRPPYKQPNRIPIAKKNGKTIAYDWPSLLVRLIVDLIDRERWLSTDLDVKGVIYEELLSRSAAESSGGAGQYFTPRPIIQAVVDVMQPRLDDQIMDPAAGTGGFLGYPVPGDHR